MEKLRTRDILNTKREANFCVEYASPSTTSSNDWLTRLLLFRTVYTFLMKPFGETLNLFLYCVFNLTKCTESILLVTTFSVSCRNERHQLTFSSDHRYRHQQHKLDHRNCRQRKSKLGKTCLSCKNSKRVLALSLRHQIAYLPWLTCTNHLTIPHHHHHPIYTLLILYGFQLHAMVGCQNTAVAVKKVVEPMGKHLYSLGHDRLRLEGKQISFLICVSSIEHFFEHATMHLALPLFFSESFFFFDHILPPGQHSWSPFFMSFRFSWVLLTWPDRRERQKRRLLLSNWR